MDDYFIKCPSSWLGGVISDPDYNLIIDNPTSRSEPVIETATYEQEVLGTIYHRLHRGTPNAIGVLIFLKENYY